VQVALASGQSLLEVQSWEDEDLVTMLAALDAQAEQYRRNRRGR